MKDKQHYANLHETYNDAKMMYDFMSDNICTDLSNITIMSYVRDFHRIYTKPKFQGDFMQQMFELNTCDEQDDYHMNLIKQSLQKQPVSKDETWDSFKML